MKRSGEPLALGPEIIQLLLPHRRPFLMVDRITAYARKPQAVMQSVRSVSINEPIFDGHFPGMALFPGALILEGLGQTAQLLGTFVGLQRAYEEMGGEPDELLQGFRNLELGFRFDPGFHQEAAERFLAAGEQVAIPRVALTAAVNMKFLKPVFAGEQLVYTVWLTRELETMFHFDLEAEVHDKLVARGSLTGALMETTVPSVSSALSPKGR